MAQDAKVAVVTGGGAGLGLEMARRLRRDGRQVAILGRKAERLRQAAGDGIHPFPCDVSDDDAVRRTAVRIAAEIGPVDVLVNNAGLLKTGPFLDASATDIQQQIAVNVLGVYACTRHFAGALRQSRGTIINISSALAARPIQGLSVYIATKGAVEAFTRAMALELAPEIRVNAIAPALVRSDIFTDQGMPPAEYQAMLETLGSQYVLRRYGEPEDIANAVAFLASPESSWITGSILRVDGGSIGAGLRG